MPSSIAYCGLTLALALAGGTAFAAELVTTSESDSDGPLTSVVIVDPLDGAVIPPVYPVVIEYETFGGGLEIHLAVDDVDVGNCAGQEEFTCTLEVTLTPGVHTLRATSFDDAHAISVTVEEGATTDTDTGGSESSGDDSSGNASETGSGSDTSGNPTTGVATGDPATEGDASTETSGPDGDSSSSSTGGSSSDGAATTGDGDGDKGCACSTGTSAPDLLGLALVGLLAPWRRRRRA